MNRTTSTDPLSLPTRRTGNGRAPKLVGLRDADVQGLDDAPMVDP